MNHQYKIKTDPVTGKQSTSDDHEAMAAEHRVKQTRRELREMLAGNVQFHEDPRATPKPPAEPDAELSFDFDLSL